MFRQYSGLLHFSEGSKLGSVLVSGAGGGTAGPCGAWEDVGVELQKQGVTVLRIDYRKPANLAECLLDTLTAIDTLQTQFGVEKICLAGWSFGGAVVIKAASRRNSVVAISTVASQTAGTEEVSILGPRCASLFMHGDADTCLTPRCSKQLYSLAREPKELEIFEGDNHGLQLHYQLTFT